ncbi:MAG: tetratricopeptide repeat protein [Phycisphaerae bacterium]|nr:tetratricopeptide repeat protein [Phycisphaerae bacterium]
MQRLRNPDSCGSTRFHATPDFGPFLRAITAAALLLIGASAARAADEPDDSLPSDQRRLVVGLIQRDMPELVEELLADAPVMHRVYIARAFAHAAATEKSAEVRERLLNRAIEEYRRVIQLSTDPSWMRGERRSFDIAQWRVELGDLILRYSVAADLDQFEITAGIKFDADRLASRLKEARDYYLAAGRILEDLDIGLRTNEEQYLLLGIADQIPLLLKQQRLNRAWTEVYLAAISAMSDPARSRMLEDSLAAFDQASRTANDPDKKYAALLGAGVALRELGRLQESLAALERVIDSTASLAVTSRAEFELAKALVSAKRFEDARRRLDRLAGRSVEKLRPQDAGASFYVRIAPLIRARTYVLESRTLPKEDPRREALEKNALSGFESLAAKGGAWPRMVQVYLDDLAGRQRSLEQLSNVEILIIASEAMSEERFANAEKAWRLLLERPDASSHHHEARFNLGVCLFQQKELRAAAETFLDEARQSPPRAIEERACDYAYRCWRQLVTTSHARDDYLKLAEAADLLASAMPSHPEAAEARWVAALSLEEGGEFRRAAAAYGRIPESSAEYWQARRNAARCRQRLYEALPRDSAPDRQIDVAREAVDGWIRLMDDLVKLAEPVTSTIGGSGRPSGITAPPQQTIASWIEESRLAACSLLISEDVRGYRRALELLEKARPSPRVLGLRIRCLQALGDIKEANRVLEEYLKNNSTDELGTVLVSLAAEMEAEVNRLAKVGRTSDARKMAAETVPTIRHLLDWISSRPEYARHVSVVRFSLANMLAQADRYADAMQELESLISKHPSNGNYLIAAARLRERMAAATLPSDRDAALLAAEAMWERLLKDGQLRNNAPSEYWEARYHWLRHRLRRGEAREVMKGIQTEQAWHPDLGGPPWQGLLLELLNEARQTAETSGT